MAVWYSTPVDQTPEILMRSWQIMRLLDTDTLHFVGQNVTEGFEGRVSSSIVRFFPDTMRGYTKSGRVYQLDGPMGFNNNGMYVLDQWLKVSGNPDYVFLTPEQIQSL